MIESIVVGTDGSETAREAVRQARTLAKTVGDLIVVGNKGMKAKRFLLGSVPDKISHYASCSVWIIRTM